MRKLSNSIYLLVFLFLFPFKIYADAPQWEIIHNKSKLTFTAMQNDAPVTGAFNKFTGDIFFATDDLANSRVIIIVDTNSVSASYSDLVDVLKTPEWFNVKLFPHATFKASQFEKISDKTYEAKGMLTIRDKTLPVVVTFNVDSLSGTHAMVSGSAILKRNAFGVGQGEWSSEKEVKDDVEVNFVLYAVKK